MSATQPNNSPAQRPALLTETGFLNVWADQLKYIRGNDRRGLPRFGLLTIMARRTPIFLYDHPALKAHVPTAFTDGSAAFCNLDFFVEMLREEQDNPGKRSVAWVLAHELMHKAYDHCSRLTNLVTNKPAWEALNVAQDIWLNMRLLKGYDGVVEWGPILTGDEHRKPAWGCSDEEIERYWGWTEEQIFKDIYGDVSELQQAYQAGYEDGQQGRPQTPPSDPTAGQGQPQPPSQSDTTDTPDADASSDPGESGDPDPAQGPTGAEAPDPSGQPSAEAPGGDSGAGQDQSQPSVGAAAGADQNGPPQSGAGGSPAQGGQSPGAGAPAAGGTGTAPSGAGGGQPGQGGAQGDRLAQAYGQGYADGQAGKAPRMGRGDNHTMAPDELRDILAQAGLGEVADKLRLPRKGDKQGLEARAQGERDQLQQDLEQARQEQIRSGGQMAGGHVEEAFATAIEQLYEPKLTIRTALRQLIQGEGINMAYSETLPDPLYYVDPGTFGAEVPVFEGTYLPAENRAVVAVIVDTSGSMSDEALRVVFSEAFGMVSEEPMEAPQLRIYSADTAVRGEPLHITAENWEDHVEGLCAYGRGGTSFQEPLEAVLRTLGEEHRPIAGVVYFSDTQAAAPDFEALMEIMDPLPATLFIAPEDSPAVSQLRDEVEGYAEVYAIDEMQPGEVIELGPRP